MKSTILKVCALMLMTGSLAQAAGKLNMDARIDAQGQSYNDAAKTAVMGHDNYRYYLKTARLDYQNSLNEKTSFRGRLVLNTTQGTVNSRDNLNNTVDLFFVNYKLADGMDLTAGKFTSDMGGLENQYSGADVYLFSEANGGVSSKLDTNTKAVYAADSGKTAAAFTWANTGITKYYTGVKLAYKFSDQELALHNADLPADDTTSGNASQTRTMTGLVYKGSFMEKMLMPIFSYHTSLLPGASSGSVDAKANFIAAGLKVNVASQVIDIDYLINSFPSRTTSAGSDETDTVQSTTVAWSMPMDTLTPKVKIESSKLSAAATKIYDVTAAGVALEWKPVKEENFRFHTAYNMKQFKPVSGDTIAYNEFMVGMRINADFLK